MCLKCGNWLNNCGGVCQSSVLHHLNGAEHENVTLRNDVHVGMTTVECHHCGINNDLVVGFASVEANSVAVVLSRQTDEPCNRQWRDLTDEAHFLSYMINVPGTTGRNQSENRVCVPHTSTDFIEPGVRVSESQDSNMQSLPVRFENGAEYATSFGALIKLESEHQKRLAESTRQQVGIQVRWENLQSKKAMAYFTMEYDEAVWKPTLGERMKLRRIGNGHNWTGIGRVVKIPQNYDEEVGLEMETSVDIPKNHTTGYSVTHVWMSTTYDRMISALEKFTFVNQNKQNLLYEQILGTYEENAIVSLHEWNNYQLHSVPSLPPLSSQQESAVKKAMQHRLTLIQGPTASGKTVTLLSILFHLVQKNQRPVLVCAPTNTVVDHLALGINRMKLKVVRLFAETRPSYNAPTNFLSLETKLRSQIERAPEIRKLQTSHENRDELSPKEKKKLREWRRMVESNILDEADVICCTCIAAGDERLSSRKFNAVLIDEAMQATEPECVIPISLECEFLVLVGDHFQLNPVVKCKKAAECGLRRSMFKRLVDNGMKPLHMTVQYRMHPKLWHFPCSQYTGSLPSGVSAAQRKLSDQIFPWPNPDFPFMFSVVRSFETISWPVKSYVNKAEASKVEELVTHFLKRGITPDRIGVITPYIGQKKYLMLHMEKYGPLDTARYKKIEVGLVDDFQGREKDIIIVSCVRSEGTTGVGSLNYFRRFHLILTRARFGLIIVGNPIALAKSEMWKGLLSFCEKHNVMVEGKLDNLYRRVEIEFNSFQVQGTTVLEFLEE